MSLPALSSCKVRRSIEFFTFPLRPRDKHHLCVWLACLLGRLLVGLMNLDGPPLVLPRTDTSTRIPAKKPLIVPWTSLPNSAQQLPFSSCYFLSAQFVRKATFAKHSIAIGMSASGWLGLVQELYKSWHRVRSMATVPEFRKEVLLMISRTGERVWSTSLAVLVACATLLQPGAMPAAPVVVRHTEGLAHGFLVLRTLAGDTLADGDLIRVARGDRVTCRLVFRFKDGSVGDETAVFSQRHNFRLLNDHLVQKGPAFQHPMKVSIDGSTDQVTVRSIDDDGKEKVVTDTSTCRRTLPTAWFLRY